MGHLSIFTTLCETASWAPIFLQNHLWQTVCVTFVCVWCVYVWVCVSLTFEGFVFSRSGPLLNYWSQRTANEILSLISGGIYAGGGAVN